MRGVAACATALALLAGCGGGGGPHLSEAAYQQRAGGVCGRYQDALTKLGQPTKLTQIGPYITRALPILTKTVGRLGTIHPPTAREDAFGRFLASAQQTVSRARALRAAAGKADAPTVQRLLGDAARASGRRAQLARAAGLPGCALG